MGYPKANESTDKYESTDKLRGCESDKGRGGPKILRMSYAHAPSLERFVCIARCRTISADALKIETRFVVA